MSEVYISHSQYSNFLASNQEKNNIINKESRRDLERINALES